MREPYPDRFRLILNDLGAGLAARGDDLEAVIERSNPALQQTDEVLAILAKQNKELKTLARDGDQALQPLAAKRDSIGRFINAAATTAAATAERRADLEAQFQKLPGFLRELRLTMEELDDFNESSTPVLSDLSDASEDLTRINVALGPFADAGTISLKSLGTAADAAGPDLVASQPVLKDIEALAKNAGPVAKTLAKPAQEPARARGYKSLTTRPLQPRRRDQRLRLLRALPARRAPDQQLCRLRDRLARGRVHLDVRGRSRTRRAWPPRASVSSPSQSAVGSSATRPARGPGRPDPRAARGSSSRSSTSRSRCPASLSPTRSPSPPIPPRIRHRSPSRPQPPPLPASAARSSCSTTCSAPQASASGGER